MNRPIVDQIYYRVDLYCSNLLFGRGFLIFPISRASYSNEEDGVEKVVPARIYLSGIVPSVQIPEYAFQRICELEGLEDEEEA